MKEEFIKPVFLKLNNSQSKIDEISSILKNSFDEKKIIFSCKISEDKMGYEFHTNDFTYDNFLEVLGIRVGEMVHSLRSTLDNLIYLTACSVYDPPSKPNKLYFPVFENEDEFYKKTKDVFAQLPESVKSIIIQAQPFSQKKVTDEFNSEQYFLSIIHSLDNIDKHRTPKVLLAILDTIHFNGSMKFDNEDWEHFIDKQNGFCEFYPVKPNSKVFEFRTTEKIQDMEMEFNLTVQVQLEIFSKNYNMDVLQTLHNSTVHFIIDYLKRMGVNIEIESEQNGQQVTAAKQNGGSIGNWKFNFLNFVKSKWRKLHSYFRRFA